MANLFIPTIFKKHLIDRTEHAPIVTFYGGRAAGRSHSIARAILCLGSLEKLTVVCGRQFWSSISDSVKTLFDDLIDTYHLGHIYTSTRNSIEGMNGTKITFMGLERNKGNIKGLEGIDIFWLEEGQYTAQESIDLLIPTLRRNPGAELWISMNVNLTDDPAYQEFIANPRPGSIVQYTNYLDNPFISPGALEEAAYLYKNNHEKYVHIWLGEPITKSDLLVYNNWDIGDTPPDPDREYYYGLDFGYKPDPTALIKISVNEDQRILYIHEEGYETKVEIDDMSRFIKTVKGAKYSRLVCDNEPRTISYLQRNGFKAVAARKGPGSILEGIKFVQNYKIIVNPKCINTIYELRHYFHEVDSKTGKIRPDKNPVDKDNHLMDAMRYALEDLNINMPAFITY